MGVGVCATLFPVFKCASVGAAGGGVNLPSRCDFSASKPSGSSEKISRFFVMMLKWLLDKSIYARTRFSGSTDSRIPTDFSTASSVFKVGLPFGDSER